MGRGVKILPGCAIYLETGRANRLVLHYPTELLIVGEEIAPAAQAAPVEEETDEAPEAEPAPKATKKKKKKSA